MRTSILDELLLFSIICWTKYFQFFSPKMSISHQGTQEIFYNIENYLYSEYHLESQSVYLFKVL